MRHARTYPTVERCLQVCLLAVALLLLHATAAAAQVVRTSGQPVNDARPKLTLAPVQVRVPVTPGGTTIVRVRVRNLTHAPVSLDVRPLDLVSPNDPDLLAVVRHAAPRAGGSWLYPEIDHLDVGAAENVDFDVAVRPPADAEPGVWPAALVLTQHLNGTGASTTHQSRVDLDANLASELLLVVAGAARVDAKLIHPNGRRLLTHGERGDFTIELANRGTSLVDGSGSFDFSSKLASSADEHVDLRDHLLVLPNSSRRIEVRWSSTPWIGWFSPKVTVTNGGDEITHTYPTVFVIPPWWVFVLVVLAIALPVWARRRRRARIARLVDEARAGGAVDDLDVP